MLEGHSNLTKDHIKIDYSTQLMRHFQDGGLFRELMEKRSVDCRFLQLLYKIIRLNIDKVCRLISIDSRPELMDLIIQLCILDQINLFSLLLLADVIIMFKFLWFLSLMVVIFILVVRFWRIWIVIDCLICVFYNAFTYFLESGWSLIFWGLFAIKVFLLLFGFIIFYYGRWIFIISFQLFLILIFRGDIFLIILRRPESLMRNIRIRYSPFRWHILLLLFESILFNWLSISRSIVIVALVVSLIVDIFGLERLLLLFRYLMEEGGDFVIEMVDVIQS